MVGWVRRQPTPAATALDRWGPLRGTQPTGRYGPLRQPWSRPGDAHEVGRLGSATADPSWAAPDRWGPLRGTRPTCSNRRRRARAAALAKAVREHRLQVIDEALHRARHLRRPRADRIDAHRRRSRAAAIPAAPAPAARPRCAMRGAEVRQQADAQSGQHRLAQHLAVVGAQGTVHRRRLRVRRLRPVPRARTTSSVRGRRAGTAGRRAAPVRRDARAARGGEVGGAGHQQRAGGAQLPGHVGFGRRLRVADRQVEALLREVGEAVAEVELEPDLRVLPQEAPAGVGATYWRPSATGAVTRTRPRGWPARSRMPGEALLMRSKAPRVSSASCWPASVRPTERVVRRTSGTPAARSSSAMRC